MTRPSILAEFIQTALAGAVITATAFGMGSAFPNAVMAQDTVLKPVKLITLEGGEQILKRRFFGQVTAKQTVDLAFQVGGQILEFPVKAGQVLPKGALIAQLDQEPFELQLEQARLQKEQADRDEKRNERLSGTVSQVAIEDAHTDARLADVAVRNAKRDLKNATIHAPFQALVARRTVAQYTTVSQGTPVARIHDMSELHIEIDVPEVLFQTAGRRNGLTMHARFPESDLEYPVEIIEYVAEASSVGQSYRVSLKMDPPKDRQILPGASATVTISANSGDQKISIAAPAVVLNTNGDPGVMVFSPSSNRADDETGVVEWVAVSLEPTQTGDFYVTSGVESGQEIVATGGSAIPNGATVRRFVSFSN